MISIIVPIYNTSRWLPAALDSATTQSFTDWELLAIDDGSTDDSLRIAQEYAAKDSRIRVIGGAHAGVAQVRNLGIQEARGELIAFLDSDDIWLPETLEVLHNMISNYNAEIAAAHFIEFADGKEREAIEKSLRRNGRLRARTPRILSGVETVRETLYQKGVATSLWGKIFHKRILEEEKMKEGEIYEDLDLFYRVALKADRIAVSPLFLYLYRQRSGSIIHTFSPERLAVLKVTERMHSFLTARYPSLSKAALDRRYSANFNMLQEMVCLRKSAPQISPDDRLIFEEAERETREFLKKNSFAELKNRQVRIKNRVGALLFLTLPKPLLNRLFSLFRKK